MLSAEHLIAVHQVQVEGLEEVVERVVLFVEHTLVLGEELEHGRGYCVAFLYKGGDEQENVILEVYSSWRFEVVEKGKKHFFDIKHERGDVLLLVCD